VKVLFTFTMFYSYNLVLHLCFSWPTQL